MCYVPVYTFLQQTKLYSCLERLQRWFVAKIGANENKYRMLAVEGSFRLQTLVELLFHTLPMMIVILLDSNEKI